MQRSQVQPSFTRPCRDAASQLRWWLMLAITMRMITLPLALWASTGFCWTDWIKLPSSMFLGSIGSPRWMSFHQSFRSVWTNTKAKVWSCWDHLRISKMADRLNCVNTQTQVNDYCTDMMISGLLLKEFYVQKAKTWCSIIDIGSRCRSADKIIWSYSLVLLCNLGWPPTLNRSSKCFFFSLLVICA